MINFKTILLIHLFVLIFIASAHTHVMLDYPEGGETFQGNEIVEIQWHVLVSHGDADWDLNFSNDGGASWESIVQDLPQNQLGFAWTVPNIDIDTGQIEIVQDNLTGLDYNDISGDFTIISSAGSGEETYHVVEVKLYPAYPNPFNPSTTISFELSHPKYAELVIYNIKGQYVRVLAKEHFTAGTHSVIWDGLNDREQPVDTGSYLYQLRAGAEVVSGKMVLMK